MRDGRGNDYAFISPDGEVFKGNGIAGFAREHGLSGANMFHVHVGERNHHKGWTNDEAWHKENGEVK